MNIAFLQSMVLFLWISMFALHPLHITSTNIEYVEGDNRIEISIRIFKDDFELALTQDFGHQLNLLNNENGLADSIMNLYIQQNFIFHMNDKTQKLKPTDKKISLETVQLNYTIQNISETSKIKIENKLLTSLYPDQKNLVMINFGDKTLGYTLSVKEWKIETDLH